MTYYTIYQITNKINGKIYIGSHKTGNLDDNYMGSGKYLAHAINKHGLENFTKEILFVFDNPDDMYAKEAELVDDDFLAEANTYNLKRGGFGGYEFINSRGLNKWYDNLSDSDYNKWKSKLSEYGKKGAYKSNTEANNKSRSLKATQNQTGKPSRFLGKKHTAETKKKISKSSKFHQSGIKNSQYGTMWIYNENLQKCKKIRNTEDIPEGWQKGYKLSWKKKIKVCAQCGQEECPRPEICNKYQRLRMFVKYFDFDETAYGSLRLYEEYDKVVNMLHKLYNDDMLSIQEITDKFGLTSNERTRMMFKSLNIERRTLSDAAKNYCKNKLKN